MGLHVALALELPSGPVVVGTGFQDYRSSLALEPTGGPPMNFGLANEARSKPFNGEPQTVNCER